MLSKCSVPRFDGNAKYVHYAIYGLGSVNPWHWLLANDPLRNGLSWQTWLPPVVATTVMVAAILPRLSCRDLH
jgi:hypothetical protein